MQKERTTKLVIKCVWMKLLGICASAKAVRSTNHLHNVRPEQGETSTVKINDEKVRKWLLRICACATTIIITIYLLSVFVQDRVTCKLEQK